MDLPASNTDPAASCSGGQSPRKVSALCTSVERNLAGEAPEQASRSVHKTELGQCPEAGDDLSNRADSLRLVARLMPLFTTWHKMSIVNFSIICAWRGLIPLGPMHRRCCKVTAKSVVGVCLHKFCQRGKEPGETQSACLSKRKVIAYEAAYRGPCCTEPPKLAKCSTEQSHIT